MALIRHKPMSIGMIVTVLLLWIGGYVKAGTVSRSNITAATVISDIRYYIRDTEHPYRWPDAQLLVWIDEAVRATVNQTRCMESAPSGQTVYPYQKTYSLSGTWLDIEKVEYDSGDTQSATRIFDLKRVPFTDMHYGREKEIGNPKTFSVWNDELYLWPMPGSDQSGTSIYVYAVSLPSGVSLTSSPIETPAYLDTALYYHIKAQAMFENGEEEKGEAYLKLWEAQCLKYRQDIMRREVTTEVPR